MGFGLPENLAQRLKELNLQHTHELAVIARLPRKHTLSVREHHLAEVQMLAIELFCLNAEVRGLAGALLDHQR